MTEMELGGGDDYQEHDPPETEGGDDQEESEGEAPDGAEEGPDPVAELQDQVARLTEALQAMQKAPASAQATAAPKPHNFPAGSPAAYLSEQLQALRDERDAEKRAQAEAAQRNAYAEQEMTKLTDVANQYLTDRASKGDPEVTFNELAPVLIQMNLLGNRKTSYSKACELAYKAIAYDRATKNARTQGQFDVRKPTAVVPAFTPQRNRPQARPQAAGSGKPLDPLSRIQKERDEANNRLAKVSPDDMAEFFGR